jgi:hypothetical protein
MVSISQGQHQLLSATIKHYFPPCNNIKAKEEVIACRRALCVWRTDPQFVLLIKLQTHSSLTTHSLAKLFI